MKMYNTIPHLIQFLKYSYVRLTINSFNHILYSFLIANKMWINQTTHIMFV